MSLRETDRLLWHGERERAIGAMIAREYPVTPEACRGFVRDAMRDGLTESEAVSAVRAFLDARLAGVRVGLGAFTRPQ